MAPPIGKWAKPAELGDQETCQRMVGDAAIEACTRRIRSGEVTGQPLAVAYRNRGIAMMRKSKFDRAIADFDEAIRLIRKTGLPLAAGLLSILLKASTIGLLRTLLRRSALI